jgi:solute carrier family 25 protein 33/36
MKAKHLPLLLICSFFSSCWARFLVPVELCYPTQTKRCGGGGGGGGGVGASTSTSNPLRIPHGGSTSSAKSILRGGKSACRGGSTLVATNPMTMTASRMKLFNLLSGGAAGTVASCITNPLEVIKMQLQSSSAAVGELSAAGGSPAAIAKKIFEKDGIMGFWKGMKPTLIGIIPCRSVYFYSYEQSKRYLGSIGMREGSVPNALISGLAAGVSSNTLTNPIWMVKSRLQLLADSTAGQKAYTGYRDVVKSIFREEGVGGFYKGISASYWGCLEGATQFMIYEQIKTKLIAQQNVRREEQGLRPTDKLSQLSYFLSAAVAKGTASIITYPHEVARTRIREQARNGVFKYNGMWHTIGVVAKEEGWKGLYSGMGVHLMKVVPNTAIMFLTYEVVNSWLGRFTVIED